MSRYTKYTKEEKEVLLKYASGLSEKARRHFLAVQYRQLGIGSQRYIAEVFGCSRITITKGCRELSLSKEPIDYHRQRKKGGGRKKKSQVEIDRILTIVTPHMAGSPTDSTVKWTHLRPSDIAKRYQQKWGAPISNQTVKRILREAGFCKRRPSKSLSTGKSPHRAAQFKLIFQFMALYQIMEHNPILSIDTKKKERLGNLDRGGQICSTDIIKVPDHDYSYLSDGKVIPFGIYDAKLNTGYVSIGTSHETAEFIGDSLIWWWENYGIHQYPDATHILLFCDCGGGNGYRHYAFKKKMLEVARYLGVRIQIAHYPPYCSKWNPIEHRLFSQMHHAANGCLFINYQQVKEIYEKTSTKTGLKVYVRITDKEYPIGLKIRDDHIDHNRIVKHPQLPLFNYTMLP